MTHYAARFKDFDAVFEAIVRTKLKLDIHNSALALLVMAELAIERLDEMESTHEQETGDAGADEVRTQDQEPQKPKARKARKQQQQAEA